MEQQLVHQCLLPRDNLPLGPGEYTPQLFDRHISTPSLGRSREPANRFQSTYSSRSPSRRSQSPPKNSESVVGDSYSEFKTIHHFNDERQPFDPKNKFCATPGPLLGPDDALHSTSVLGSHHVPNTVHMNTEPPKDGRFPIKKALPCYDVRYDSLQVRPTARYGTFSKDKRIYIPLAGDSATQPSSTEDNNDEIMQRSRSPGASRSPSSSRNSRSPAGRASTAEMPYRSITEARCALVRLPKLKTKAPPVLHFRDTSYKNDRLAKPLDLTPSLVNKKAYTHLFDKYLAIPRKHKSSSYHQSP